MRVLLIATHYSEYVGRLAIALSRHHQVQLHLSRFNADNELSSRLRAELAATVDLHIHPRPVRKLALVHGARFALAIRRFRPDVVHVQEAAAWTLLVARILGLPGRPPWVLTVHDPSPHPGADLAARARTRRANGVLRRWADAVIVHGERLKAELLGVEPSLRGRVHAVAHGALGEPLPGSAAPIPGTFLFFGRIVEYKGLGVLVTALERLLARGTAIRLHIAGTGPDLERYRGRLAALGEAVVIEDRYVPAEEVASIFSRSMAIVMPYTTATQSGVAALAFTTGRPLVVSDVGSMSEVVRDGENGLLVRPGDPEGLADAMERIAGSAELRDRLSRGARATAAGELSWDAIAARTLQVYDAARRARAE